MYLSWSTIIIIIIIIIIISASTVALLPIPCLVRTFSNQLGVFLGGVEVARAPNLLQSLHETSWEIKTGPFIPVATGCDLVQLKLCQIPLITPDRTWLFLPMLQCSNVQSHSSLGISPKV